MRRPCPQTRGMRRPFASAQTPKLFFLPYDGALPASLGSLTIGAGIDADHVAASPK
jgi:hypothetical protein